MKKCARCGIPITSSVKAQEFDFCSEECKEIFGEALGVSEQRRVQIVLSGDKVAVVDLITRKELKKGTEAKCRLYCWENHLFVIN